MTEKLLDLIRSNDIRKQQKFLECQQSRECECDACPIMDDFLNHRFYCIEYNSDLYRINKMVDYRTYDFEDFIDESS